MKTTKIIIGITASLLIVFALYSSVYAGSTNFPGKQSLNGLLKSIKYPAFGKSENLNGDVAVSFTINDSGKIQIEKLAGNSDELTHYIQEQLNGIELGTNTSEIGKNYCCRFKFRLL
jgi:hypothetical protein